MKMYNEGKWLPRERGKIFLRKVMPFGPLKHERGLMKSIEDMF